MKTYNINEVKELLDYRSFLEIINSKEDVPLLIDIIASKPLGCLTSGQSQDCKRRLKNAILDWKNKELRQYQDIYSKAILSITSKKHPIILYQFCKFLKENTS
jgi:hypothetical protein